MVGRLSVGCGEVVSEKGKVACIKSMTRMASRAVEIVLLQLQLKLWYMWDTMLLLLQFTAHIFDI
jgi:hypothetical protein